MTDEEKLEWFNKTMDWLDQFDSADAAIESAEDITEIPYDLFFDVVDQWVKCRENISPPTDVDLTPNDLAQTLLKIATPNTGNIEDRFQEALLDERDNDHGFDSR